MSAAQEPIKFWTYSVINYTLLKEDVDSAANIPPGAIFLTRQAALEAIAEECKELVEYMTDGDSDLEAEVVWSKDVFNTAKGHYGEDIPLTMVVGKCDELDVTIYLYEVYVRG